MQERFQLNTTYVQKLDGTLEIKLTLPIFHMFIMSTLHKWTWAVIMAFAGVANMT